MSAFNSAWVFLKNMTTDMYEYPKGSGSFVAYDQLPKGSLEKIEADNDRSRENLQNATPQPVGAHAPHLQQHYSNSNPHTPPSPTNDPLGRALEAARNENANAHLMYNGKPKPSLQALLGREEPKYVQDYQREGSGY